MLPLRAATHSRSAHLRSAIALVNYPSSACLTGTLALPLLTRCIQADQTPARFVPHMDQLCPPSFLCPIGREVMGDPVMCTDGHSYERTAIATWLRDHATSPCTNLPLTHLDLVPNIALRNSIEEWVQQTSALETSPASREVSAVMNWMGVLCGMGRVMPWIPVLQLSSTGDTGMGSWLGFHTVMPPHFVLVSVREPVSVLLLL